MAKMQEFWDALGNKAEGTKDGYKTAIWQFLKFVMPDATRENLDAHVDEYFASGDMKKFYSDFRAFLQEIGKEDENGKVRAPLGILQTFNQVKNWFALCDVEFSKKQQNLLKNHVPKGGVQTRESDLDADLIRQLLQYCDLKGRAMILCLASGGMRISELLEVQCEDISFKDIPTRVDIVDRKNGRQRYTFVSSEATAAVKEWIKVRGDYLVANQNRGLGLNNRKVGKDIMDNRLFPFDTKSAGKILENAVLKATGENKKDANTGIAVIHMHMFRKFFISQLALNASEPVADFFAGHKTGLSDNYRRYTSKQMAEYYLKGENNLLIEAPKELRELGVTTTKKMQEHSETISSLLVSKDALRDTVEAQANKIAEMSELHTLEEANRTRELDAMKQQLSDMHDLIIRTNLVYQNKMAEMITDFRHDLGIDEKDEIKEYEEEVNKMNPKEKAAHEKGVKQGTDIAKKLRVKGKLLFKSEK